MSANTIRALVVAFVVVVGLFVLFGGGAMTGGRMGGDMMGNAWMGGFGWMWIPAVAPLSSVTRTALSGKPPGCRPGAGFSP